MNILGPDALVFVVDDVEAASGYLTAFGLDPAGDGRFEALDSSAIVVRRRDDPSQPPSLETGAMLRQTVYGVADAATVAAIAEELAKDRQVHRLADGAVEAKDDHGFALRFQVTRRRPLDLPPERINAPGSPAQRPVNQLGVWQDMPARARSRTSSVSCRIWRWRKSSMSSVSASRSQIVCSTPARSRAPQARATQGNRISKLRQQL